MNTPITFRFAEATDVNALLDLVESAYRGDASRAGWTTEADLLDGQRTDTDELLRLVTQPITQGGVLLAFQGETLLACANLERHPQHVYFGMFSVRPLQQGTGIGRAVLAEVERLARLDWQLPCIRMTVIVQRHELIEWYLRRGYRGTGERQPWPYGNPKFGLPKRDDLGFVVLEKRLDQEVSST